MNGPYAFLQRAEGIAVCEVRGVLPAGFLNYCALTGIVVLSAEPGEDDSTLIVTIPCRLLPRAKRAALKSQCELNVLRETGGRVLRRRLLKRCVPIVCLSALCLLLLAARCFIWEITVTGNERVPTAKILNALAECGVAQGCFWPSLTSDNVRSELLVRLPELSWATVNIYGSRAEAIVRERVPKPEIYRADTPVDIVSTRLGFVTQVHALNGTARVRPGSAVVPGQVLIAGETNSAFSGNRSVHALGTVRAETYYELTACTPVQVSVKQPGRSFTRWAVQIGKNRYNIYGNSSICRMDCDKIKTVWKCEADGLFSLPLALIREQYTEYTADVRPADPAAASMRLEQTLYERLTASLGGDAEIRSVSYSRSAADGRITVCLRAQCSENIAAEQLRMQEEATS